LRRYAAVMTGALVMAGFICMSLSAATYMSLDMFDFVMINNLDKRLKTAELVYFGRAGCFTS
jgi:hypothetical protein